MNAKLKDFITAFIIQLVLTLPFYTANVYGLTISNVRVTKVTSSSAAIEWETDNSSNGRVKYGKTTALGFTQRHDDFIGNHTVTLVNGIDSDTAYFFAVESTDLAGNTAINNNSNNFYTFKTTDVTPPPQVTGLRALSTTSSSIFLTWNTINISDLKNYAVYKNRIRIANATTNSFNDTNLTSNTEFSYKISAVDNSSNEGPQSDTLIASTLAIDSSAPVISNIDVLPITDTTAKVTWLTDENSTTAVLYGANKTDKIKSSDKLETNHSIVIDSLVKDVLHFYTVKSCDKSNNCANSSNHSFIAGRDVAKPFLNLSIPRFVNRRILDIRGLTEPFSSITLFVNDMRIPKRSLSSNEIGKSGKFVFSQIQLEQDNIIKLAMVDKSGNRDEKTFEVSVDTEAPIVQLNQVPSLTSKANLTISGSVNEPVAINVFVDVNVNESDIPSKITGLNATKIGQNSVELHWHESKDSEFSHYVVYRDDIAIALTKPANFNLFIDALVDTGKSYTYKVSAVNIFGEESPKSEPITATTLKGGAILNLKPAPVDIFEDFRKPMFVINATAGFNFPIKLNKGDAEYTIKLIFKDRADNSVLIEKSVALDTKKPEIKITSPPSGALIFENLANNVDIIGKTKPNARVHLFINRTPCSSFDKCFEASGVPNELQDTPEAKIDAKCRFEVAAKSFCPTGADFSVDADNEGNFKFKNVDFTVIFASAFRITEVQPTEFRDVRTDERVESKPVTLVVVATDKAGQRGIHKQSVSIGTCWSGNQSWDIIPLQQYQSPTLVSTSRLAEGTEIIYFYFNYSYIGRGTSARITSINMLSACGTRELLDPRFNISCQILPSGSSPKLLNPPDNTISYSAVTLSRFPGMDSFLEDEWKSFFKAINKELTFPLKVRITYKHDTNNDGDLEQETQTSCEQVTYTVDNSIVDPRKVLPDWMLFNLVDILQDAIKTLTDVQKQINKVLDYVAVGCLASWSLNFILQIYRRWITFWEEKAYLGLNKTKFAELIGAIKLSPAKQEDTQYCKDVIENIVNKYGKFRLKYVNDFDLKRCFPSSAAAWATEAKVYQLSRWSCDRVFGHAAPARWTETKSDKELITAITSGEGCAVDQSVMHQPLKAESCRELIAALFPTLPKDHYGLDDKCFLVQKGGKKALFKLSNPVEGKLYEITQITKISEIDVNYAIKRDEFNYMAHQSQSCNEICGIKQRTKAKQLVLEGEQMNYATDAKGNEVGAFCTTVDKCRSLNVKEQNKKFLGDDKKYHDVKSAETRGYTSDCFYQLGDSINVISDSPSLREECCCVNSKSVPPSQYYQPDDKDPTDEAKFVHESRTKPGEAPQQLADAKGYSDMKWSYRYWKERFEAKGAEDGLIHNEYNKNRYIEGRDLPACFGQNNILYGSALTVNPFKQHEASIQCLHIAGISNRMQFIKNLMTSFSTCLIHVRTTGRGNAGACKELFSQHLCGAIWQVVRAFVDGCVPLNFGIDLDSENERIIDYVRGGFKGVYESVSDLQSQITNEYGNAKLNELIGTGEESIARKICLAAFGYDWEINLKNIVDAAYTTPFATLVQPITGSREFLTVDPSTLKPRYEYRASWIINPGCDFERYDVYLTCVGRKQLDQYPNSIKCGSVGAPSIANTGALGTAAGYSQCDCIHLSDERRGDLVFTGRLTQNILEEKDIPANKRVIESDVRYDHLKFVLRTDRKIDAKIRPNCFPQGYDDGVFYVPLIDKSPRDIFGCRVDYLSGSLICNEGATFATKKGIANFIDVKINDIDSSRTKELVFSVGDPLIIEATIRKIGKDKCLKWTLDGETRVEPITLEGPNQYQIVTSPLTLGQRLEISEPPGIRVQRVNLGNAKDVSISVRFYDTKQDNIINFEEDTIEIDGEKMTAEQITSPNKKIVNEGAITQVEVSYSNQKILLKKERAEVEIVDASLQRDASGKTITTQIGDKNVGFVGGAIVIRAPIQTPQLQAQPKTLKLELYHIKDSSESYTVPQDCELNDAVFGPGDKPQRRDIAIRLELQKPTDSRLQGPIIRNIRTEPSREIKKGDIVTVSASITHSDGIKSAQLDCQKPDAATFAIPNRVPRANVFEFVIDQNDITIAGRYKCKLTAESNNPQARVNTDNVEFEVSCGEVNNYGLCKPYGSCPQDRWISSGLVCKGAEEGASTETSEVCCRT